MGDEAWAALVAGEDAVGALAVSGVLVVAVARGDVGDGEGAHPDLSAAVAAVEPQLIAVVAAVAGLEVADRQVLDRDAVGLVDLDPVAPRRRAVAAVGTELLKARGGIAWARGAGLGSVDDDAVALHAAQMNARGGDQHASDLFGHAGVVGPRLVVVARSDQHPVAGLSGIDRGLDRCVRPGDAVVAAHPQHAGAGGGPARRARNHEAEDGGATGRGEMADGAVRQAATSRGGGDRPSLWEKTLRRRLPCRHPRRTRWVSAPGCR